MDNTGFVFGNGDKKFGNGDKNNRKAKTWEPPKISHEDIKEISKVIDVSNKSSAFIKSHYKSLEILKFISDYFDEVTQSYPSISRINWLIRTREEKENKKFNKLRLERTINSLKRKELIEVKNEQIELTNKGSFELLKVSLEQLTIIKPLVWDRLWRLVSYDIPKDIGWKRDELRNFLQNAGFCKINDSLYIHAYPCEKQIKYIKEILQLHEFMNFFTVKEIENDKMFKDYFSL